MMFLLASILGPETAVLGQERIELTRSAGAKNPDPKKVPTLAFTENRTLLQATFPNVPNFTCDFWCYESEMIEYVGARDAGEGSVELHHNLRKQPHVKVITTVRRCDKIT
jgi:hypothetical protein